MADPQVRAIVSERTRAAMVRPDVRERVDNRSSDPAWRRRVSEGTKAAMSDAAVRQLISDRTKAGILAKAEREQAQLKCLEDAWASSSSSVKRRFLEIHLSGSETGGMTVASSK